MVLLAVVAAVVVLALVVLLVVLAVLLVVLVAVVVGVVAVDVDDLSFVHCLLVCILPPNTTCQSFGCRGSPLMRQSASGSEKHESFSQRIILDTEQVTAASAEGRKHLSAPSVMASIGHVFACSPGQPETATTVLLLASS